MNIEDEDKSVSPQNTTIYRSLSKRKWYYMDLKGKIVGRLAPRIVTLLRGKDRKDFLPNLDSGAHVVLVNASAIRFTGNKLNNKYYYNHSGHPGGIRRRSTKVMLKDYPVELTSLIIKGMMPHTKLGKKQLKRLFIYPNDLHSHKAQEKDFIKI